MSSPIFHPSTTTTDSNGYKPSLTPPEHLMKFENIGKETRAKMTEVMQSILQLTDKMALRGAATMPEGN